MFEIKGKYTTAKVMIDVLEASCIAQIQEMCNNSAFTNPISIMPDAHTGSGSCIGFTMKATDKIIPNVVSVDIGCGMLSYNIGKVSIDHERIDREIRDRVPFGKTVRAVPHRLSKMVDFKDMFKRVGIDRDYALRSIGSLGGGNHFCEIGVDENKDVWVTVHTGSRNLGKKVCEYWQKIAVGRRKSIDIGNYSELLDKIKMECDKSEWSVKIKELKNRFNVGVVATGLEYLEGSDKSGYIRDMFRAQEYAHYNRVVIMEEVLDVISNGMGIGVFDMIESVHNFMDPDDMVIRKGAIRSYVGEKMVIPFNMRDGLLICEGKSNESWNFSAPHGAGRVLSRSMAKKSLDIEEFRSEMDGIFSTSVCSGTLDESPMAYKDSKIIEEAIGPTANILLRVKPIHNMKDNEGGERD